MDKKGTFIILGIVITAIIGFVIISFQRETLDTKMDIVGTSATDWVSEPAGKGDTIKISEKTVISGKHAYQNGVHTIAGEIPLPTTCHLLESQAMISSDKKEVFIVFTSSIKGGETCTEHVTPARFKITAKAAKTATMRASLNGQEVTLNLIEAGPDENLENFELYIKG